MSRALDKLFYLVEVLMAGMLGLMIVLVFMNVILRYFFNSGITWSEEMARYLFVWIIYIGAIGAMRDNTHLGVDTVIRRMPPKIQKVAYISGQLLILGLMLLLWEGSWNITLLNVDAKASATNIPLTFIYGIGLVTSGCIAINVLANCYKALFVADSMQQLLQMQESEEEMLVEEALLEEEK
jgi:TRAP-type C4-dicarboxylate transport system permease small subunit